MPVVKRVVEEVVVKAAGVGAAAALDRRVNRANPVSYEYH
jgi:hypothetical protein